MRRFIVSALVVVGAVAVVKSLFPDANRYLKMRAM